MSTFQNLEKDIQDGYLMYLDEILNDISSFKNYRHLGIIRSFTGEKVLSVRILKRDVCYQVVFKITGSSNYMFKVDITNNKITNIFNILQVDDKIKDENCKILNCLPKNIIRRIKLNKL